MNKVALMREMNESLEAANKCSEALEALLKEAKATGRPTPDLVTRISVTNRQCDEHMERYITAYRGFYHVPIKR